MSWHAFGYAIGPGKTHEAAYVRGRCNNVHWDSGGNRIREKESNNTYRDFFYDSKNQLTRETKRSIVGDEDAYGTPVDDTVVYDYSYTFDAVGNRLTYKDEVTQTTTAYTYNSMNQMLTAGNTSFGYDDNGSMVSKTTNGQTTTQSWDCFGKLVKLQNPDGSVVKFVYDGVGHRVKRWRSNGNESVIFVNDKSGDLVQLLSELDASGNLTARYSLGNTLLTMDRGNQTYSYHFDALGSTRELRNPQSAIANAYAFDAYGNVLSASETVTNSYQFVAAYGYYSDPDTGLLYLRARYYSPSIGRFVSMDSYVGKDYDPASLHRYIYCKSSPLAFIDPSGMMESSDDFYIGLGILVVSVGLVLVGSGMMQMGSTEFGGAIIAGALADAGIAAGHFLRALGFSVGAARQVAATLGGSLAGGFAGWYIASVELGGFLNGMAAASVYRLIAYGVLLWAMTEVDYYD